jgi:leucyl aminopeptidase (aminopeptidase T)
MIRHKHYAGVVNFLNCVGIKSDERVLILMDEQTDLCPINALKEAFSARCKGAETLYLPIKLESDFPVAVKRIIGDFDVIIIAASQSWYQAPTRKKAKYEMGKRVVECYGLRMDMLTKGALCVDPKELFNTAQQLVSLLKPGKVLKLETRLGTSFTARIHTIQTETGNYSNRSSGGNLPAGEISLGLVKGTANGTVVFDVSMDILGSLNKRHLSVEVRDGKTIGCLGRPSKDFIELLQKEPRLRNIAEVGIGINSLALLGRSVIEDEKKIGSAHIGFGNDSYFGGNITGPHYDAVLSNITATVGAKLIIRRGRLAV